MEGLPLINYAWERFLVLMISNERRGSDRALLASPCLLQASLLAASYGSWILIRNVIRNGLIR